MNSEYRDRLLSILARLDRLKTDAEALLEDPGDSDNIPAALQIVTLVDDLTMNIEGKLTSLADLDPSDELGQ